MSYSRWGASCWYTFWACQDDATENRDTSIFEICGIASFTAAELRADIEKCLNTACNGELGHVSTAAPSVPSVPDDREELRGYMSRFLAEVGKTYPEQMAP